MTLRLGNGFVGRCLPRAWALIPTDNPPLLALSGGCRQHFNFHIDNFHIANKDGDAALDNLEAHNVKYYGPRYNERGETHIDFEDPDCHLLEYWAVTASTRRPIAKAVERPAKRSRVNVSAAEALRAMVA